MADIIRSLSTLQSLLADNNTEDISAQDLRDLLVSVDPENAVLYDSLSNLPGNQKKGFLYFPSDGANLLFDNLSAYKLFGPLYKLSLPPTSFSWVNQGTATLTTTNGSTTLSIVNPSTGINHRIQVKSIPATPYSVVAGFYYNTVNTSNAQGMMYLRNSSSGANISFHINQSQVLGITKWNSPTSFNANYAPNNIMTTFHLHFLKISDDGTTRRYYYSPDNVNWIEALNTTHTDYITPDQIGFALNPENGKTAVLNLIHWLEF